MSPLSKDQNTSYQNDLNKINALTQSMQNWPEKTTKEYATLLSTTKQMQKGLQKLNVDTVSDEESNALLRSLNNCLKLLNNIDNAIKHKPSLTKEQVDEIFTQLNADLPVMMKSQTPHVTSLCEKIFKVVVCTVLFALTPAMIAIDLYLMFTGAPVVATMATLHMMGWSLNTVDAARELSSSTTTNHSKEVGTAMNELKNVAPAYKAKIAEREPQTDTDTPAIQPKSKPSG